METHNASIYHCVTCSRVVHAEFEGEPPQCCGRTMAKAFTETIRERRVAGENRSGPSKPAPPERKGRVKRK